jgi:hypothetical protein
MCQAPIPKECGSADAGNDRCVAACCTGNDCAASADGPACLADGTCGCNKPADCKKGACVNNKCVSSCIAATDCDQAAGESCCGPAGAKICLVKGIEVCDGKDNDCDGIIDNGISPSNLPLCTKQKGVCKGSRARCVNGAPKQPCDDSDYRANSPDYEPVEQSCDGLDNDCNGKIDEPAACGGPKTDAGPGSDVGSPRLDGGGRDTGSDQGQDTGINSTPPIGGCGCQQSATPLATGALLMLAALWRSRRRA